MVEHEHAKMKYKRAGSPPVTVALALQIQGHITSSH